MYFFGHLYFCFVRKRIIKGFWSENRKTFGWELKENSFWTAASIVNYPYHFQPDPRKFIFLTILNLLISACSITIYWKKFQKFLSCKLVSQSIGNTFKNITRYSHPISNHFSLSYGENIGFGSISRQKVTFFVYNSDIFCPTTKRMVFLDSYWHHLTIGTTFCRIQEK